MRVERLSHLVLTVRDVEATCEFYERVLGMRATTFGGRRALTFGSQKINLHQSGNEFEPRATCPAPWSAELCFVTESGAQGIGPPSGTRRRGRRGACIPHRGAGRDDLRVPPGPG